MLDVDNLNPLRHEPSAVNHAIRLESNLIQTEISGSTVTANARLLLRPAAETGELKLTATGNFSRDIAIKGRRVAIFVVKAHNPG